MKKLLAFFAAAFMSLLVYSQQISLNGLWKVKTADVKEYSVHLPGTLDDAGIGTPVNYRTGLNIYTLAHLSRRVQYIGNAFYTTTFTTPATFRNKQITLILGRVLWKSSVMIDNKEIPGNCESLSTAHEFDITPFIIPGKKQSITICIDNSNIYPGINIDGKNYKEEESKTMMHAYTNHTQIKWNGVLGELTLKARPVTQISNVEIQTDIKQKKLQVNYSLKQKVNPAKSIYAFVTDMKTGKRWPAVFSKTGRLNNEMETTIPFSDGEEMWSEFSPRMYELVTILKSAAGTDTVKTSFGIRDLRVKNNNLVLNGNRIFIRSNLECIIFPLTGYPPMLEEDWKALYTKAKSWGLNSFRFHSWCPPEVAFSAADKVGFYLQVELPHWNLKVGEDTAAFGFLTREGYRILHNYGNHPSFMFFSMGNELEGDFNKLNELVAALKKTDTRHLYSTTTFTFQKKITGVPQPEDDYFVTQWTKKGWVRGQGVFNDMAPDFSTDYTKSADSVNVPLISHEIGQYSVFPDLSEIEKYKGNLVPVNFMEIKKAMEQKGLLSMAAEYLSASGRFATILYKEEIERALKTKSFDGFQLLQLQDFPGQGTALVGLLNAFWESKKFVSPTEFHQYCSEVTPLIRFEKAVYKNDETFKADVELANFYKPLTMAELIYSIIDEEGNVLQSGTFDKKDFPVDNSMAVGKIKIDLAKIKIAKKLTITVKLNGTSYLNNWNIWVYPSQLPDETKDVLVTTSQTEAILALGQGEKVLLCPPPDTINGITGKFVPVFWSPVHFPDQPGTMGLLIKSKHKALQFFPTDDYSNWQWWDLTVKSKALNVGNLPAEANIVRPIDNFVRNENLSSLFEVNVLKGKLIFCSINIIDDMDQRPQARQLRYSLLQYMNSNSFKPENNFTQEQVSKFFK
ncbi:MAG: sugar-binding domain-containing protein [Chitinophagaceae bacterium]